MMLPVEQSLRNNCKGNTYFKSGVPESFNVLVKEIRALGLNIELN